MKVKNIKITDLRNIEIFEGKLGDWNVLEGKNGSGKSTVIDAIFWAIRGKTYFNSDPFRLVKHDKEKAIINLVLEGENREIIINRIFTQPTEGEAKGYDTLRVVDTSGASLGQKELNAFFSSFTIDPLHIARQKPKDQIETIKEIAGVDTTAIEEDARVIYDKRTEENRELTRLKNIVTEYAGVEKVEEISVKDLIAERDRKQEENRKYENCEADIRDDKEAIEENIEKINRLKDNINDLEGENKEIKLNLEKSEENKKNLTLNNLSEITEKINKSEEINENARKYKEKQENIGKLQKQQEICTKLDTTYKETLDRREKIIKDSNIPEYITFDKTAGVLVHNIAFSQLNTAEQIKTSIQLGSILTPELKILHIKDGSLLDEDTLKEVKKIVEEHGYQILIERVGEDDQATIVMREGVQIVNGGKAE